MSTLSGHSLLVRALAYDAASKRLVSASYDMTVKVWDLSDPTNGKLVREFKVHEGHIFDVKFDVRRIIRSVSLSFRLGGRGFDLRPAAPRTTRK